MFARLNRIFRNLHLLLLLAGLSASTGAWAGEGAEAFMPPPDSPLRSLAEAAQKDAQMLYRRQAMDILGVQEDERVLFIFVSTSMPESLLRQYVDEAAWTGAQLVVKGVPPGMSPKEFLVKQVGALVKGAPPSVVIRMAPQLFDLFDVTVVPTIAYAPRMPDCEPESRQYRSHTYQVCRPAPEGQYVKISGGVSLDYALQQFIDNGFLGAKRYLDAYRAYFLPADYDPNTDADRYEEVMSNREAAVRRMEEFFGGRLVERDGWYVMELPEGGAEGGER